MKEAREFLQVCVQVEGENARRWMEIAQCFAGPPKDPPAPGTRAMSGRQ